MNDFDTHVRVLAVGPLDSDLAVLSRILSHSAWTVLTARTVEEARQLIDNHHVHVVLTDRRLPDGDWRDMLALASRLADPAEVIVLSPDGDERLWAEVLNRGAWDVLLKPYHPKEVFRTVHAAWQHGTRTARRRPASVAPTSVLSAAN